MDTPKPEKIYQARNQNEDKESKNELTIIYCPPFTLPQKILQSAKSQLKIQYMRKLNHKSIRESTILTQNLQGAPQLCANSSATIVLFCHDQQDQAVKNQLLYSQDYYVDDNYQDIDST